MVSVKAWCNDCDWGPVVEELTVADSDMDAFDHAEKNGHRVSATPVEPEDGGMCEAYDYPE